MRIFGQTTLDELMKLIEAGDERVLPSYAYVTMGYRLMCAWLGEANGASTEQIIKDAAFALSFVHLWRDCVLNSVHKLQVAFLTRETFLDVVTVIMQHPHTPVPSVQGLLSGIQTSWCLCQQQIL